MEGQKQLIILGSSSFLGRSMPKSFPENFSQILRYTSRDCDLRNPESIANAAREWQPGCHILFLSVINKPIENTENAYAINMKMAQNVAHAANLAKASSVLFLSSVDIYGNQPINPVTEATLANPDSWYSKSKLDSENLLKAELNPHTKLGIFRCCGIFNLSSKDVSVIGKFHSNARSNQAIVLHNNGVNLRDFVCTDDLYQLFALWFKTPISGLWNAASGHSMKMSDIAQMIIEAVQQGELTYIGTSDRNFNIQFDCTTILRTFGTNPLRPFTKTFPENLETSLNAKTNNHA